MLTQDCYQGTYIYIYIFWLPFCQLSDSFSHPCLILAPSKGISFFALAALKITPLSFFSFSSSYTLLGFNVFFITLFLVRFIDNLNLI